MSDTSDLEQKAVELLTNLEKLAEPAMQLTLKAVRMGAIIDLATALLAVAIIAIFWKKLAPGIFSGLVKKFDGESDHPAVVVPAFAAGLMSLIFLVAAAMVVFSTNTWLGILSPELALARMLIEKAS